MTHVKNNSGNKEWYTPPEIVKRVRKVLGEIDLDPASSYKANQIVMAKLFFTMDNPSEAFDMPWYGRVFMNPPYGQPDIARFTDKFLEELGVGHIRKGITLTNNATETKWFQKLAGECTAICLPKRRIKYYNEDLQPAHSPLQGQVLMFFKPTIEEVRLAFRDVGSIFVPC